MVQLCSVDLVQCVIKILIEWVCEQSWMIVFQMMEKFGIEWCCEIFVEFGLYNDICLLKCIDIFFCDLFVFVYVGDDDMVDVSFDQCICVGWGLVIMGVGFKCDVGGCVFSFMVCKIEGMVFGMWLFVIIGCCSGKQFVIVNQNVFDGGIGSCLFKLGFGKCYGQGYLVEVFDVLCYVGRVGSDCVWFWLRQVVVIGLIFVLLSLIRSGFLVGILIFMMLLLEIVKSNLMSVCRLLLWVVMIMFLLDVRVGMIIFC